MIRSNHTRQRRAGVVVEMAVISVVCLAFMFAIFEYGRVVMVQQVMENASRAGARSAVVVATGAFTTQAQKDAATAAIATVVTDQLAPLSLKNINVNVFQADDLGANIGVWTSTPFGKNIVVQVTADCPNLFPTWGFLPNSSTTTPNAVTLTATTMMRGEAN